MKQAIKDNALSLSEASELYQLSVNRPSEEVEVPEHLWDAVERLSLWEMEPVGSA